MLNASNFATQRLPIGAAFKAAVEAGETTGFNSGSMRAYDGTPHVPGASQ
jgi:hypothetical protein